MNSIYDHDRFSRIGLPEAVLCEGKSDAALTELLSYLSKEVKSPVLLTRLVEKRLEVLDASIRVHLAYDPESQTAFLNGKLPRFAARVAVVAAGTSDLRIAKEACRTLEFLGAEPELFIDVGVAGLWRLQDRISRIREAEIVIVVAGMDAALASVVTGLVPNPVIGVPTSTGYGVAVGGRAALHAMLASCSQGLVVTNIDNGFGAACAAVRMIKTFKCFV